MGKIIGKIFPVYAVPAGMASTAAEKAADIMAEVREQEKHLAKLSRAQLDAHAAAEGTDTTCAKNKEEAIALIVAHIAPECTNTWPQSIPADGAPLPPAFEDEDPDTKYLPQGG